MLGQLQEIPLGKIRPQGWLLRQLRLQADGITGQLEALWPDVGPTSGWLGGPGENWERGPYYLDGLLPLAYVLDDPELKQKAQKWLDWIFASQSADGWFGPAENNDWWPRMVVLKVLIQYAGIEAHHCARVEAFLEAYFNYQLAKLPQQKLENWAQARGGENLAALRWLQARRPSPALDALAKLLEEQTLAWDDYLHEALIQTPATHFEQATHVVNVAMAIKNYAVLDQAPSQVQRVVDPVDHGHNKAYARTLSALERLDRYHGQVTGIFSGDEWLAGNSPSSGVETCAVAEFMYSLQYLWRHFRSAQLIDRLERVGFNALPAALSADMAGHQYHQQPNQIACTIERRAWTFSSDACNTFGLEPHFGCCTANLHQAWPKFAAALWAMDADGNLVVGAYAPNQLINAEWSVSLTTDYPFDDQLLFNIDAAPANGKLYLRIPEWCRSPSVFVDGEAFEINNKTAYFALAVRAGQSVRLQLPRTVDVLARPRQAVSVRYGALIMCLSPGEIWQRLPEAEGEAPRGRFADYEVRPRTSWNMALVLDQQQQVIVRQIEQKASGAQAFSLSQAAIRLQVHVLPVKTWQIDSGSAALPPISPVFSEQPVHGAWLVPYGCARLRIAEFPWAVDRPLSH